MGKTKVFTAMPYDLERLRSNRSFSGMYIRQFNFPDVFDSELDSYEAADNDVLREKDCERHNACFKKHTGTGELGFDNWIKNASEGAVLNFLKDILEVDLTTNWTGYRILVSRDLSNGYKIWYLVIFSKHPNSDTEVYTGEKAPNVRYQ